MDNPLANMNKHILEPDYREFLWDLRGFWNVHEEDKGHECTVTQSEHDTGRDSATAGSGQVRGKDSRGVNPPEARVASSGRLRTGGNG